MNCASSRLIFARFKGQGINLSIIQAYAPTSASSAEEIGRFYNELQSTYDGIDKSDLVVLMADWNAKVGDDWKRWTPVIDKFGLPGCHKTEDIISDQLRNSSVTMFRNFKILRFCNNIKWKCRNDYPR